MTTNDWNIEYESDPLKQSIKVGTGHHKGQGARAWNYREFISFDGEGIEFSIPTTHILPGTTRQLYEWEGDRKVHKEYKPQAQPYVLLGNSKGERITNKDGLPTIDCLEFLLESKVRHPNSHFVG